MSEETPRDPRDTLFFMDQINEKSIRGLFDQIRSRTPKEEGETLDVVFTSGGGSNRAAVAFNHWMSRFPGIMNVRFVAAADVVSSALTAFLAGERRATEPTGLFRLHGLAAELPSNNTGVSGSIATSESVAMAEDMLVKLIAQRTKLSSFEIRKLMKSREPLSGEILFDMGICNERL